MKKKYTKNNFIILKKKHKEIIYFKKETHLIITGTNKKYQIEIFFKTLHFEKNISTTIKQLFIQKKNHTIFYLKFIIILDKKTYIKKTTKVNTNKYTHIILNYNIIVNTKAQLKNLLTLFTESSINININTTIMKLSKFELYIISKLNNTKHNYNITTTHINKRSSSLINCCNILHNSTLVAIDIVTNIEKIANKTKANIINKTLIIKPNNKYTIKPQFKIYNNDVLCNHSVCIDTFNKEIIQYILCKGHTLKNAKALYIKSILNNVLKKFKNKNH